RGGGGGGGGGPPAPPPPPPPGARGGNGEAHLGNRLGPPPADLLEHLVGVAAPRDPDLHHQLIGPTLHLFVARIKPVEGDLLPAASRFEHHDRVVGHQHRHAVGRGRSVHDV